MVRHRTAAVIMLAAVLGPWAVTSAAAAASTERGDRARDSDKAGKVERSDDDVVKAGWWWAGNQPPAETGLVAYPQQNPPNVPPGSLPVAAAAGEPEKISAIEVRLDVADDETTDDATDDAADGGADGGAAEEARLVLRESTAPGANSNAESATVLACPVTEAFWADGSAARWDSRPSYDCDLAQAEGDRRKDGRWVFDLAPLAAVWLGEALTTPSFVLVESVDSPESFQVAFEGLAADGIKFRASYLPTSTDVTGDVDGEETTGDPAPVTGDTGGTSSGSGLSSGAGSSGSGSISDPASLTDPGDAAGTGGDAAASGGDTATSASSPSDETSPLSTTPGVQPWHAGLVKPALILVPLAIGLAYLAMVALGPDAQPTVSSSRHGVGRALERLRRAPTNAITRTKTMTKVAR